MLHLLWDASALTKRYAAEVGTPTANALFYLSPKPVIVTTYLGYGETFATLWRKRNRGLLADPGFRAAASSLQAEVLSDPDVRLLTVENAAILGGTAYVQRHNLNASDAAILTTFLDYAGALPAADGCLLIAADQRLLNAAGAQGLRVLNPETVPVPDLPRSLPPPA